MYSYLSISTSSDPKSSIPNTFLRQDADTDHLTLILPGLNYTCDMPLLYYSSQIMLEAGADVVQVKYDYTRTQAKQTSSLTERFSQMKADVIQMALVALQQRKYKHLTLIGKSLGTLAIPNLLKADLPLRPQSCVYLTPILNELVPLRDLIQTCRRNLFVIGTSDRYFDLDLINQLISPQADNFMIIDGVNHSLEYSDDTLLSLEVLDKVIRRMKIFLTE